MNLRNKIIAVVSLLTLVCSLMASPVYRVTKTIRQSDGTSLTVTRVGADHLLYYITSDGVPVFPNDSEDYCYAEFDNDGNVVASATVAHEATMRTVAESHVASQNSEAFYDYIRMRGVSRYGVGNLSSASVKSKGDVRIAVILAEFQDLSFAEGNDEQRFYDHFNASSYTQEGGAGSVRDYFIAQSDSLFRPSFDIVAKVKVSRDHDYYGKNQGSSDVRSTAYMAEATDSAIAKGVDFSKYLNDKGELFVIVIYPGHGEQVSGESDQIWASYYYSMSHQFENVRLTSGLVMDELADYGAGEMFDGIGTLCHEFSHALGLPDFYNTTSATNIFGMDAWSIMDYGQYCNMSRTPVGYTSYEREFMGWLKIDTLYDVKQKVAIAPLHSQGKNRAYRILNSADETGNEYYLLENRQNSPWYMKLYGEGMLVLHVDYNANAWSSNSVNNKVSRQRMTIIPADNTLTRISSKASDYKGDPFPGLKNVTELSSTTTPSTKVYTGGCLDIRLKDIREVNDTIYFYYQCNGQLATPKKATVTSFTGNEVALSIDSTENAEKYIISVYDGDSLVYERTVSETEVRIDNLTAETTYTVRITAVATDYLDSTPLCTTVTPSWFANEDVNKDGEVNSADVVSVYNYILKGEDSGIIQDRADVDKNGHVNTADVTSIYNKITGN
jgi:M6 family metalloprotease-like protein